MNKAILELKKAIKAGVEPSEAQRLARAMAVHASNSFTVEEIIFTTRNMREKIGGASC